MELYGLDWSGLYWPVECSCEHGNEPYGVSQNIEKLLSSSTIAVSREELSPIKLCSWLLM
jgi:hypothetical protein